jgi:hypothetical protein
MIAGPLNPLLQAIARSFFIGTAPAGPTQPMSPTEPLVRPLYVALVLSDGLQHNP